MRIGIPNTLFAAYHLPYWQQFLNHLGMEVIISDDSCQEMVDTGSRLIPHEFCVPIKSFLGHVINLIAKRVDFILVPRMISQGKQNFFCPKLTGLPEIVKYAIGIDETTLFSPEVICNGLNLRLIKYPQQKVKSNHEFYRAGQLAKNYWEQILVKCRREQMMLPDTFHSPNCDPKNNNQRNLFSSPQRANGDYRIQLALLGYAYALYDPFISKGIISKLSKLGAKLSTWEMVNLNLIENRLKQLKRPLFWNFGRILLGAGLHFLDDSKIDGIIYLTTFGCGPDSIAIKLLNLEANWNYQELKHINQKPFLQITLDEHQEDGHLQTRLEAFTDMLLEQKEAVVGR